MKKIVSLILVFAMLLSCIALVACTDSEETKTKNKQNTQDQDDLAKRAEEGDIFAERALVDDGLDDYDFGGKTLRVVCHNDGYEVFAAEEEINKGDLIKDAKANRNKAVEDKLNINIELTYNAGITELQEYVSKTILSGVDEFDLIVNHILTAGGMVTKNLFLNWYDIPKVDFSKPWWAASTASELTYDGKCILAISDINATSITSTCVIAFNKNLAASYDMGNLYDVVLNGEWTYDYMYNLIKDIYVDSDGSGTKTSGDFYGGAFGIGDTTNAWLWAFDNPVVTKNEEGVPAFSIKSDKINNIMQTLFDFYYNTPGIGNNKEMEGFDSLKMFTNKQCIMTPIVLGTVTGEQLRNFEDDYGILPYPKWDEYQNDYHSHVYGESTACAVPKTAKDLEFIGVCTEALSYESWKTVTPTIYETALKTRYLRDSESKEVLDIVLDQRYFDFGFVYDNWQGFAYTVMFMLRDQVENFESYYAKRYGNARIHLKKVIKAFDKLT
ncbi:MAG: hypothetical protein E7613_08840 [Ruminococcaceae bacterium]|nr:hypothetical protein [Oscillospiraceae bacterium]